MLHFSSFCFFKRPLVIFVGGGAFFNYFFIYSTSFAVHARIFLFDALIGGHRRRRVGRFQRRLALRFWPIRSRGFTVRPGEVKTPPRPSVH